MKAIDLLNKIAKGEEVPKKIKILNKIWEYDKDCIDFLNDDDWLFYKANTRILNVEVEIIEEEKDIEELSNYAGCNKTTGLACGWSFPEEVLKNKINELVREVNKLKRDVSDSK